MVALAQRCSSIWLPRSGSDHGFTVPTLFRANNTQPAKPESSVIYTIWNCQVVNLIVFFSSQSSKEHPGYVLNKMTSLY